MEIYSNLPIFSPLISDGPIEEAFSESYKEKIYYIGLEYVF